VHTLRLLLLSLSVGQQSVSVSATHTAVSEPSVSAVVSVTATTGFQLRRYFRLRPKPEKVVSVGLYKQVLPKPQKHVPDRADLVFFTFWTQQRVHNGNEGRCCWGFCCYQIFDFSIPQGSVVSQPIVMKRFTHINGNILHQTTWQIFDAGPN